MTEYRDGVRTCPQCAVPMGAQPAGDAEVDVCPDCSGVWVDWTDGELSVVTRRMGPLPAARPEAAARGSHSCPDCQVPLVAQEARPGGSALYRCGECGGAFLPLATLRDVEAVGGDSHAAVRDETPALTRMLDALFRWFTG
jgi:Zn-finger nucleic acid-binding protein